MADLSLDDELLALAGGVESAEEGEASEKSASVSGGSRSPSRSLSRSLSRSPPPASPLPRSPTPTTTRRSPSDIARGRSERRTSPDEDGELSDARSDAGSAAMEESDSEEESDAGVRRPPPGETTFEREKRLAEEAEIAEERARTDKLKALIDERTQASKPAKRKAADDDEDLDRRTSRQRTKKDDEDTSSARRRRLQRKYSDENDYMRDGYVEETTKVDEGKQPGTLAQYQRVRLGRTRFAEVCFFNDFEDVFNGCFVRVHIDVDPTTQESMYRMCQIKGFKTGKPYILADGSGKSHAPDQYVQAEYGGKIKEYPFSHCSDGAFTEDEFNRRNQLIESEGLKQVTSKFLDSKCAQINDFLQKKHTSAEIDAKLKRQYKHAHILQQNKQATVGPETLRRDEALHRRNLDMARLNAEQSREAMLASRKQRQIAAKKRAKRQRDIELGLVDGEGNAVEEGLDSLPKALPRYEWMGVGKLARLRTDAEILGAMDFDIDASIIKL